MSFSLEEQGQRRNLNSKEILDETMHTVTVTDGENRSFVSLV